MGQCPCELGLCDFPSLIVTAVRKKRRARRGAMRHVAEPQKFDRPDRPADADADADAGAGDRPADLSAAPAEPARDLDEEPAEPGASLGDTDTIAVTSVVADADTDPIAVTS